MGYILRNTLVSLAVVSAATSAYGQEEFLWGQSATPPWGYLTSLVVLEPVRRDLNLGGDQVDQVTRLVERLQRENLSKAQIDEAFLASNILSPSGINRLGQIRLQYLGAAALFDPKVQKLIGITPEQKVRLGEVRASEEEQLKASISLSRFDSAESLRLYVIEFWRHDSALRSLLSFDQEERLRQAMGRIYPGINHLAAAN